MSQISPSTAEGRTFQDIATLWRFLEDVDDPLGDKNSTLARIFQESEEVHVKFYNYMHEILSVFENKDQAFAFKICQNAETEYVHREEEMILSPWSEQRERNPIGYNIDALLGVFRSKKALADRIATVDIHNTQHDINGQLEMIKSEAAKTLIHKRLAELFVECTVCIGSIVFTSKHLGPIFRQVPKSVVLGFLGGTAIMMGFADFTYATNRDNLHKRANRLHELSNKLYQLQYQADAFRAMISDLINDIQYVKIMKLQGKEDGAEKLNHKLLRIKREARKNELLIKCVVLKENPFVLFEE